MDPVIIAGLIAAIPATLVGWAALRATNKTNDNLRVTNGTTVGDYSEQTFELVKSISHRQDEISKKVEDHHQNKQIHVKEALT